MSCNYTWLWLNTIVAVPIHSNEAQGLQFTSTLRKKENVGIV